MTGLATHAWVHVLGLTLLHGLWQGAAIAGLAAVGMRAVGPGAAGARHAIAGGALALLAASAVVTAVAVLPSPPVEEAVAASSAGAVVDRSVAAEPGWRGVLVEGVRRTYGMVWAELPWIVLAWSFGAAVLFLRLAVGVAWVRRVRRSARAVDGGIETRARAMARSLGLRRSFDLATSGEVEVPTVVGWRRPTVLLPNGLTRRLSARRLDALIAHELAHVRENDGVPAVVHAGLEALLFHNPAAVWLARRARAEREHRCDDVAVEACGDLATYVRALAELESLRPGLARVGLAASGGSLAGRVGRLVESRRSGGGRGRWASVSLAIALAIGLAWPGASVVPHVAARPGGRMTIAAHDPAGRFGVVLRDGHVLAVGLDAEPLAPERWTQRGDSLWVRDATGREDFVVHVLDEGGVEWEPRPASWGTSGS